MGRPLRGVGVCLALLGLAVAPGVWAMPAHPSPYEQQVGAQLRGLAAPEAAARAGAAEALGYLRAYDAAPALMKALRDEAPVVRREAALSLGWCGGRNHLPALLDALADRDWLVRQAAWVALTNLTGRELPWDALASPEVRAAQARAWRQVCGAPPGAKPPPEVLALLRRDAPDDLARGCSVTASTTYRGPPGLLTQPMGAGAYWQTKNVPFPQHCTVDLGAPRQVGCVTIRQYGRGFCVTDFSLSLSGDGAAFTEVLRRKGATPPDLVVTFPVRSARHVRITSYASENPTYPTTLREVQVLAAPPPPAEVLEAEDFHVERGLRALGALGGPGACRAVVAALAPYRQRGSRRPTESASVQAGIRALGRLGEPEALEMLVSLLDNPQWARYAAEALGDFGGGRAAQALLAAYPSYACDVNGKAPARVPDDDRPGFEAVDRMYETPFAIGSALARLPLEDEKHRSALRSLGPLLAANLPGDYDGALLYEREAGRDITAYLLERAGLRRAACAAAFRALGVEAPVEEAMGMFAVAARRRQGAAPAAAAWLSAFCREEESPTLLGLLGHENGWVRINAAKALMFLGERRAVAPIAAVLAGSRPEAEHGFFGGFLFGARAQGHDEYDDPSPRWREAFIRALGRLGAGEQAPLLASILRDERNSLEMQYAAAQALDELGSPKAIGALRWAEAEHPYHSVRLVAREALWRRGLPLEEAPVPVAAPKPPATAMAGPLEAVVFIQGENRLPNAFQMDPWRQTYSTTDSGPTYRPGRNLYLLRPARPDGAVIPLTRFEEGYVADCEVSWDGRRVLFARRGGERDPWWHLWEVGVDGGGLRQITRGPHHDVQPAYLPDGRIVCSSSRIGMRDEYHGYLATGLTVMDADGGDIHCIGFNLGRDNEPSVLPDGRILFSRLELFYSRLKTELTLQAVFPDGTRNVTLYGPERRDFWRDITRRSGENWWGEAPPRHRVLRLTQPQPFGDGRVLCATTGGLALVGPGCSQETLIPHDRALAVTTPFPLDDGRVLCAATPKGFRPNRSVDPAAVDLGLYMLDARTGEMTLLYNDPKRADFEPRPVRARPRPPILAAGAPPGSRAYAATFLCESAHTSRESRVRARGRLVRVIEGMPVTGRHQTHRSGAGEAWKNHTGTLARVLGTVPLAADGSFSVDIPADRLIHFQVLDSDRRVVGNQQIWMYARPGEKRSCVGCHESPDTTPSRRGRRTPAAAALPPVACLPNGGEFTYRAKLWQKGALPDEGEERTRTVRAVNLLGRQ